MNAHNIIIGGVEITIDSANQISQSYETLGGRSMRRLLNGAGLLQTQWAKVQTSISGTGRVPPGLDGLDYTTSLSLSCAAPLSIWSANTSITLPTSRRTDWAPHAYAIVAGRHVRTSLSIAGNAATLTAVSGAGGYLCAYYPILTVYATPPRHNFNGRGPSVGWTLDCEEV